MTTDETLWDLKRGSIDEEKIRSLRKLLQMADLAKFAKYKPVGNENEQCFEIAKTFVNTTLVMSLDEPNEEEQG